MCGCSGGGTTGRNQAMYEVTKPDGNKVVVGTLSEAQAIVRRTGGTFRATPA